MAIKLRDLLQKEGITSRDTLQEYVRKHYRTSSVPALRIHKKDDLKTDSENRLYETNIEFENAILDVENLAILDATSVRFKNCIFTGNLRVGQHTAEINVKLFRCICYGEISIAALQPSSVVALDSVNAREVSITSSDIKELNMTACNIGHLAINEARISSFETFSNHVAVLDVESSEFENVTFDHTQTALINRVGLMGSVTFDRALKTATTHFDEFKFQDMAPLDIRLAPRRRALQASTMQFLLLHSNVRLDRNAFAHTKHLLTLASDDRAWVRAIYVLVGSLIKPWRVLCTMLATITLFAVIFMLPCFSFNVDKQIRPLGFSEATYFSGVTFTTIGFGDITPNGTARGLAVTEGISGMLLASAFLVALTRKYID